MTLGANSKTCQVDGHSITYYREGEGEVILLVHGITTYSFIWRNIFPHLVSKYDVIAVDLLGCGDSSKPLDVSYSLNDHADRLFKFVNELGIRKFHFVGHDLGGGIGQIFAVRHPAMLFDLTLINSVAYDFWPVQPITTLRTPIIRQILMASLDLGTFKLLVRKGIYHKEKVTPELMSLFMKPLQTSDGRKAFMHFSRCLDNRNLMDIAEDIRHLDLPVLIIRGDADSYLSRSIAEELNEDIQNSKLVLIPTAGHFIQEDEPEEVVAAIVDFIGAAHA